MAKGQGANARSSAAAGSSTEPKMDINSILKDIEFLGYETIEGLFAIREVTRNVCWKIGCLLSICILDHDFT
ncbi:hypothetical protein F511_23245 [Dorcoceras hygrometricum]|uniref:Uncharacterized protein n=1 Tax=Dorcoceras hygrometricum TaxID=472368 RepID=A0A2Z7BNC1_9LAMI|nr:hypothetical protein F511_23245 [Dorcoceras hygrometricum]